MWLGPVNQMGPLFFEKFVIFIYMSSKNKKKKLKNSNLCPSGLKEDLKTGVKRISFYTSSSRQKLKEELERDIQELDDDYTAN